MPRLTDILPPLLVICPAGPASAGRLAFQCEGFEFNARSDHGRLVGPIVLVEVGCETYWRVEFVRRRDSGLNYRSVKSPDLAPDSFIPLTATPAVDAIDDEWERVTYDEPCVPGEENRCFTRVEISLP